MESGSTTRSAEEWEMSRSCQSTTFSKPDLGVGAQHPGQPRDALADDRVLLVRHRRGALLAGRERLQRLPHLGALQVAELGGEAVERRARLGQRRQQAGVAVARDHLGGHLLAPPGRAAPARTPRSGGRSWRRCRRRRTACPPRRRRRRRASRRRWRRSSTAKPSSTSPKVVGSAWTPWVRPIIGVCRNSSARTSIARSAALDAVDQQLAGVAQLQRERGVDHVGRGQAVVEPARVLARPARPPTR